MKVSKFIKGNNGLINSFDSIIDLIWIGPGSFFIDPQGDNYDKLRIEITNGFWISDLNISIQQYSSVMRGAKENFANALTATEAVHVSWTNAMLFCKELNGKYYDFLPDGYIISLASEAQWEYAYRLTGYEDKFGIETQTVFSNDNIKWKWRKGLIDEWCFDMLSEMPIGYICDYFGNSEFSHNPFFIDTKIVRRAIHEYSRLYFGKDDHSIGFRVCIRPSTIWDKDPAHST